jgi:hypothetical protein
MVVPRRRSMCGSTTARPAPGRPALTVPAVLEAEPLANERPGSAKTSTVKHGPSHKGSSYGTGARNSAHPAPALRADAPLDKCRYFLRRGRLPIRLPGRPPSAMPRSFDSTSISTSMTRRSSAEGYVSSRSRRKVSRSAIHRSPSMTCSCTDSSIRAVPRTARGTSCEARKSAPRRAVGASATKSGTGWQGWVS